MTDMPTPILKSHQFFHAANHILGQTFMAGIYKRSRRQLYRWAADPDFCEDHQRNPIDRLAKILERLCEIGKTDIAKAGVGILAGAVKCRLAEDGDATPDKKTLAEECLDDLPAVAWYHEALMNGTSDLVIKARLDAAIRELEQNRALYRNNKGG